MGVTMKRATLIVAGLSVLSFIFGVITENKKPAIGTRIPDKDSVLRKYPSIAFDYLSVSFIILFSFTDYYSMFYPYKGKSVPQFVLFQSTNFFAFSNNALFTGEVCFKWNYKCIKKGSCTREIKQNPT
ncbi:uncharacterized protein LOC120214371 [Hibiscus syriacus]|uniref:uncharacterized protein LOC120214371 n=1 Tax=Hibiscus syriacus TaxID=106335 RepID=UPI0019226DAF|nr:uncharacterized protein LOC120214371 [Hibiscus syriacus]